MLELLREIVPGLKRVAMLFNPDTAPGGGTYYFRDFEAAARSSSVEPIAARARSDAEIEAILTTLGGESGDGLIIMPDHKSRSMGNGWSMSALPPKADIRPRDQDVCFGPQPDELHCSKNVAYSITSSAIASRFGGTARPSALAVLRLITSSNLLG